MGSNEDFGTDFGYSVASDRSTGGGLDLLRAQVPSFIVQQFWMHGSNSVVRTLSMTYLLQVSTYIMLNFPTSSCDMSWRPPCCASRRP